MPQDKDIFKEVQERYNIKDVAEELGIRLHRVGRSWRANSPKGNGDGKDAFAIYEETNTWYDFMTQQGGDIVDLYAMMKYDGDKGKAIQELMPEETRETVKKQISARETFMNDIEHFSKKMLNDNTPIAVKSRNYLHSRGITDETIKALKIGFDVSCGQQRIRIPYWDKAGKKILYTVSRAIPYDNGNCAEPRYKKASLEYYPFLRNAPLGLNTIKDSPYCVITEGVFDWLNFYQLGIPCLAPNGTDFGKLWPEVIEVIKQHFRFVVLAFDNDKAGVTATVKCAEILMKNQIPFRVAQVINVKDVAEYCESGRNIMDVLCNASEGLKWYVRYIKPNKDFDCLTLEQRDEAIQRCRNFIKTVCSYTPASTIQEVLLQLKSYFPKEWFQTLCREATKGLTEDEVCEKVIEEHNIRFNEKVGFYEYTKRGIWERMDDTTILGYIKSAYGIVATGSKITTTLKLLKVHELVNSDILINGMNKKCAVSFYNGTLHINEHTGEYKFLPHDPEDYISQLLPYYFRSDAKCPEWDKFIHDVMSGNSDYMKLLQEFAGYILIPNCRFQKALILKGGGSNGKSLFTSIIAKVFGDSRNSNQAGLLSYAEPAKFAKDFRLMAFRESWLNISSDVENDMAGGEGVFKKLVAGEIIEDSYKHKDPFSFRPRTKLMMCANYFPTTRDTSVGFLRRWLVVPFDQHYVTNPKPGSKDKKIDPQLEDKLSRELSGIFMWCLEGLKRLMQQNGFTEPDDQGKLRTDFARANNPLYCFLDDKLAEFRDTPQIYRTEIYGKYKKWANKFNVEPLAVNRFYANLKVVLAVYGITVIEHGRYWTLTSEDGSPAKLKVEKEDYWPFVNELYMTIVRALEKAGKIDEDVLNELQYVTSSYVNQHVEDEDDNKDGGDDE